MRLSLRLWFLTLVMIIGFFSILVLNIYEFHWIQLDHLQHLHHEASPYISGTTGSSKPTPPRIKSKYVPKFAAFGQDVDSGYLKHVFAVFEYFGFERTSVDDNDWDVLWAHEYPFKQSHLKLKQLKPHQKVNHFPGTGYITNKMDLAKSNIKYIPKAFKLPEESNKFLSFVERNPQKSFVQKSNDHRGIKIATPDDINLKAEGTFVQEYIDNPLLVDGYKFDVGVYTVITSIDPLRVYIYNGDVLFRYCSEKYHPFDPQKLNKYVVGDDYLPTWELPSLKKLYIEYGYSMRDSFNSHLKQKGFKPDIIWTQIEEAIREICLLKETLITNLLVSYASKRNFFEMIRFDFVIDANLQVYVMEANMSPNLSSAHFAPNKLLYEQVLFNLFSLVGLARMRSSRFIKEMEVADKNIVVDADHCIKCQDCISLDCALCLTCLAPETKTILQEAYLEHMNKKEYKRIFPAEMVNNSIHFMDFTPENQILSKWYLKKCIEDRKWC